MHIYVAPIQNRWALLTLFTRCYHP